MRRANQNIYNLLNSHNVLNTPILEENAIRNWGADRNNVQEHYESYLNHFIQEGAVGPIEKHPYIEKYSEDFDLSRQFLLLGTMPPSSYFNHLGLQGIPNNNISGNTPINYYYGNMQSLWRYLGFGNNLTIDVIRDNLKSKSIAISDVLSYLQRKKMKSANDSDIYNIVLNKEALRLFSGDSKIETILTTSGSLKDMIGNANSLSVVRAVKWILMDYDDLDLFSVSGESGGDGEYFPINNLGINQAVLQQNRGIEWWLRKGNKKIQFVNLPSPSGIAGTKMIRRGGFFEKWVRYKAHVGGIAQPNEAQLNNLNSFMENHPGIFGETPTKEYRRDVYAKALDGTLHEINNN